MKLRVTVLIDGSNFYFKLKDLKLNNLLGFNFGTFVRDLVGEKNNLVHATYYVGRIRQDGSKKTEKLFASQQKLIAALKKHGVRYSFGYLLKTDGRYHEKGVDVQMATDILVASYENTCDKVVLVSSDTDLAPAIKKSREKKRRVEYIGFSHQPSVAMVSFCSSSRLLTKEEINQYASGK
ncbi:MAG: NYN domain-containing protein [Patescibacteria group bacterium]